MPVLVTGAHRLLARRLVLRLLDEGGEVRAYADGDAVPLRAAGALVASGSADDEGRLEAALTDVHTAIHIGGGVLTSHVDREAADVATLVTAASNSGVARIIALSLPGAGGEATDPLRRAKGAAEALLEAAPLPTVVVRASLIDTPVLREALHTGGLGSDLTRTIAAPVRVADLVELLVAFDAARSRAATGHLLVAADGPDRLPVSALAPADASRLGRRLLPAERLATLAASLPGPWWSDPSATLDGWRFAGIDPQPVDLT